jgi:hypothetical protein
VSDLTGLFLTIHVLTAIVAFGPTFAFPLMARMAAAQPQHGAFVLRLTHVIMKRITIPLALTMPVSGGLLVWSEDLQLADAHWLVLAIGLYLVAIVYAMAVQVRTLTRMIEIAEGMAAARGAAPSASASESESGRQGNPRHALAPGPGAALAAGPGTALAVSSGAAEMARLGARVRNGGILLAVLIVLIVSLMAGKPAI